MKSKTYLDFIAAFVKDAKEQDRYKNNFDRDELHRALVEEAEGALADAGHPGAAPESRTDVLARAKKSAKRIEYFESMGFDSVGSDLGYDYFVHSDLKYEIQFVFSKKETELRPVIHQVLKRGYEKGFLDGKQKIKADLRTLIGAEAAES